MARSCTTSTASRGPNGRRCPRITCNPATPPGTPSPPPAPAAAAAGAVKARSSSVSIPCARCYDAADGAMDTATGVWFRRDDYAGLFRRLAIDILDGLIVGCLCFGLLLVVRDSVPYRVL